MRSFIALPLPDALADQLEQIAVRLRFGRAVPSENMHVTLAFLDDQPEGVLEELHEALAAMSLRAPVIAIEGLDVFGGEKPRLFVAAVQLNEALGELRRKVRQAARQSGIVLSHERFRPHVSLCRFNRLAPGERQELDHLLVHEGGFTWPAFVPAEMTLMSSTLTSSGAQYETLAAYLLRP